MLAVFAIDLATGKGDEPRPTLLTTQANLQSARAGPA